MCAIRGDTPHTHMMLGGWVVSAEDIDEHRPPDVQLGRCQGQTLVVRLHESLNSFGLFLTQSLPRMVRIGIYKLAHTIFNIIFYSFVFCHGCR